jgi:hypothetical protein
MWVLSRGCYTVRILDLANVPAAKREAAIRLATTGWSPFADTSHYVIPTREGALLCAWDTTLVAGAMTQATIAAENVRVIPESALRTAVEPTTQRSGQQQSREQLFCALDGYTGAILNADVAVAEQWWPTLPAPSHWQNFLRSAGIEGSPDTLPPEPQNTGWRNQPVGYPANSQVTNFSAAEALAVWIIAFALTMPTLWYGNQLRQIYTAKQDSAERLRQTERDLDSVLSAREVALSTQDRAVKLAELLNQVDHINLFALINTIVMQNAAPNTLQLGDWEVRPQTLKFSLLATAGTPPAATTLVKALERVPIFRDVEAKLDGSRINVTLKLIPSGTGTTQEPAAPPETPVKKATLAPSVVSICQRKPCSAFDHITALTDPRQVA